MQVKGRFTAGAASPRERAKMALRSVLHHRNLDLVHNPFPARVRATVDWLGADTILDIGANVGQYGCALRACRYRGRMISCEPLPDAYAALSVRAARDPSWTALATAVGSEPGTLVINVAANSYSSSALPMTDAHLGAASDSRYVSTVRVPVTTVAEIVDRYRVVPARTLLKIDTQGYEAQVLDGAAELVGQFAVIQLELSLVSLYAGQRLATELTARLSDAGFGLHSVEGGFSDDRTGRMLQYDGLFVRTDLIPATLGA